MQFTLASLLTLAATASAAAIAPRADYGYWDFKASLQFPANGYRSTDVTATYHSAEIAEPIEVTCTYRYTPGADPAETSSCSDPSFTYEIGNTGKFPNGKVFVRNSHVNF